MWVSQAFDKRKYAFAADYIRLYALYNYGGIYLDMDVEVLRPFDDFLQLREMICFENSKDNRLEVAAFGVEKGQKWVKLCLDYYKERPFVKDDGSFDTKVLPGIIKRTLISNGYQLKQVNTINEALMINGDKILPIFPYHYFSPKSYGSGKIELSDNTYSIHHFAGTWLPWYSKVEKAFFNGIGLEFHDIIRFVLKRLNINF